MLVAMTCHDLQVGNPRQRMRAGQTLWAPQPTHSYKHQPLAAPPAPIGRWVGGSKGGELMQGAGEGWLEKGIWQPVAKKDGGGGEHRTERV